MDEETGLFNINLSDSEEEENPKAEASARRTDQSEEAFQAVRASYRAKVENGNLYKSISLPLSPDTNKQMAQTVVHAAEELYFFRRYAEAATFIDQVLHKGNGVGLGPDNRALLQVYEAKCKQKLAKGQA